MRRGALAIAIVAVGLAVSSPAFAAAAVATTGTELASMKSGLDGRVVQLEGEVVSEALAGGDGHVWLNVLSGGTAVGIWLPRADAAAVTTFGTYQRTGDVVSVEGVFNAACDTHGGDLDVHATQIVVTEPGYARTHPVRVWKIVAGLAAAIAAYAIVMRSRARARRLARGTSRGDSGEGQGAEG